MPENVIALKHRWCRSGPAVVVLAGLCLLGSGALLHGDLQSSPPQAARPAEGRLVLVPPGTVVGDRAPEGWTHLILKTMPRIHPQQRHLVDDRTFRLSSLVFTTTLARVEAIPVNGRRYYRIGDVGVGLGSRIRGQDMVFTPDTKERFGRNFGWFEGMVISACFEKVNMARMQARTDTMVVLDTHAVMLRDGQHRPSIMRHVLLVDPQSGQLDTLSFGIDIDERRVYRGVNTHMQWLAPNTVDDCQLVVDPREFTLGIPSDLAFAVTGPPKGRSTVRFHSELATLAGRSQFTPEALQALESGLRQALSTAAQENQRANLVGHAKPR